MSSKTKKKLSTPAPAEGKKIKLPKQFIVRPGPSKPTTVHLHPEVAEAMELQNGKLVVVSKEGGPGAVATVSVSSPEGANVALVPKPVRALGGLLLGDRVVVAKYEKQPPYAVHVDVQVEAESEAESREIDQKKAEKVVAGLGILQPGVTHTASGLKYTIVDIRQSKEDLVDDVAAQLSRLSVSEQDDMLLVSPVYLFHPSTVVNLVDRSLDLAKYSRLPRPFAFEQVGGLEKPIGLLRSTVQLPLRHPQLFLDFGISPPRGILLHGPPGTGKTMLLRCVAHECDAHVLMVNGPLIVSKYLGETENALRDMFSEAMNYQPSIIFMDEIDSLAPRRGLDDAGETESRVVATLLTMMDGMGASGRVVVVGATNRPNSIDPALRRPGRFDQEVEVGIPDADSRADILAKQLARMNKEKCALLDEDVRSVAAKTHGYVGADLAALCREAVMKAIARGLTGSENSFLAGTVGLSKIAALGNFDDIDPNTKVQVSDLEAALADIRPSAMREIFLEMPKVSWDDIAGQRELKKKLVEVVQLPLEAATTFAQLGVSAPKGVLLYGPPGCSKTLTAKALASESGLNFLAVKGPEIFNKYVGESERTIREIFRKARAAAPSIIFFDEIDALALSRDDALTLAAQHVLTSLLNEIDGVEELNGVVIVAATNRPTEIDPALLRPGRLDRHIYVAPPDREARLQIVTRRCSKFNVPELAELFESLADATEGCSGAEVSLLCQEAGLAAIMENKDAEVVEARHFQHALTGISRGITEEMLEYYRGFSERSGLTI